MVTRKKWEILPDAEILPRLKKSTKTGAQFVTYGIYFLFSHNIIVYVGRAGPNFEYRIWKHMTKHWKFDSIAFLAVGTNEIKMLGNFESSYKKRYNPIYNIQTPHIKTLDSLMPESFYDREDKTWINYIIEKVKEKEPKIEIRDGTGKARDEECIWYKEKKICHLCPREDRLLGFDFEGYTVSIRNKEEVDSVIKTILKSVKETKNARMEKRKNIL